MTYQVAHVANWLMKGKGTGREPIVVIGDRRLTRSDGTFFNAQQPKRHGVLQDTGVHRAGWFLYFAANDTLHVDQFTAAMRAAQKVEPGAPIEGQVQDASVIAAFVSVIYEKARAAWNPNTEFDPDFIVTGFDEYDVPTIFWLGLNEAGNVVCENCFREGHAVVGAAPEIGAHILDWHGASQRDELWKVLYACYDTKRHAERANTVSSENDEFDITILVRDCKEPVSAPESVCRELRSAYEWFHDARPSGAFPGTAFSWDALRSEVDKWWRGGQVKCQD